MYNSNSNTLYFIIRNIYIFIYKYRDIKNIKQWRKTYPNIWWMTERSKKENYFLIKNSKSDLSYFWSTITWRRHQYIRRLISYVPIKAVIADAKYDKYANAWKWRIQIVSWDVYLVEHHCCFSKFPLQRRRNRIMNRVANILNSFSVSMEPSYVNFL